MARVTDLERARALVSGAESIVILTGAGVSAESGVPTFRGPGGLWKSFRPEELATPGAFAKDPRLVWEWYGWRRELIAECVPNPGHEALAKLAFAKAGRCTIVTQNVDGLHHVAARSVAKEIGAPSPEPAYPLEVHGAIHRDRCQACHHLDPQPAPVDAATLFTLPRCPQCGDLMRPDVVWFGEALDADVLEASLHAAREADVCLVVGTSALVYPAASVPDVTASMGGHVIEVNLTATPLTGSADVSLQGPAGEILPQLLDGAS
ncbi:MAG: NAD-dependent deacylase [Gemmatimonadota bacterium]